MKDEWRLLNFRFKSKVYSFKEKDDKGEKRRKNKDRRIWKYVSRKKMKHKMSLLPSKEKNF